MGLSMTSARILRDFAISSRSPVRRPKLSGKDIPAGGAGTSSAAETGVVEACSLAGSVAAGGAAGLPPQEASRRRRHETVGSVIPRRNNGNETPIIDHIPRVQVVCG